VGQQCWMESCMFKLVANTRCAAVVCYVRKHAGPATAGRAGWRAGRGSSLSSYNSHVTKLFEAWPITGCLASKLVHTKAAKALIL